MGGPRCGPSRGPLGTKTPGPVGNGGPMSGEDGGRASPPRRRGQDRMGQPLPRNRGNRREEPLMNERRLLEALRGHEFRATLARTE